MRCATGPSFALVLTVSALAAGCGAETGGTPDKSASGVVWSADKTYVCKDSAGRREVSDRPIPRCDTVQQVVTVRDSRAKVVNTVLPTLTEAEREPFSRVHPKLRISPLDCPPSEITFCDDMVRTSCNAGGDGPIGYYSNRTGELLGTCGFWVKERSCMPQRWRTCAVKNGARHVVEEPNPAEPVD